jgi:hypothetical protein
MIDKLDRAQLDDAMALGVIDACSLGVENDLAH